MMEVRGVRIDRIWRWYSAVFGVWYRMMHGRDSVAVVENGYQVSPFWRFDNIGNSKRTLTRE